MSDTSTVVTSENLAEFQAQRLGLNKPEPEAKEPEVADEVVEEDEQPKRSPKLQERFSELTDKRRKAEERADREAQRAEALEKERDELKAKLTPKPRDDEPAPKPKPEDYADAFQFAEDLAEWSTNKALGERDRAEAEKVAEKERAKIQAEWTGRVEAVKAKTPDYEDVLGASDFAVTAPVRDAIIESEHGPEILYLLASDPEIAEKLSKLSVLGQLRQIGKLEAQFEKAPEKEAEPEQPKVERPRAPAPITPVKGGRTSDVVNSQGEFKGSYQEWKAARAAGKA